MGACRGSRLLETPVHRWLRKANEDRSARVAAASRPVASISVVIPTKNAGAEFGQTLAALRRQAHSLEIVVVDSGSSDQTLDLAREHGARVISIAPESFNHGETRNLGIRHTEGQFCIMLVQDALPLGDSWLEEMLSPFADERVVGVTARQVPRPDSDPVARWQCEYRNRLLGEAARVQELQSWQHFETLDFQERLRLASFDNVFSALRRDFWSSALSAQCPSPKISTGACGHLPPAGGWCTSHRFASCIPIPGRRLSSAPQLCFGPDRTQISTLRRSKLALETMRSFSA